MSADWIGGHRPLTHRCVCRVNWHRIDDLARNVARFRKGLTKLGFEVIGDDDSPVVPVMIYIPTQMPALGRMAFEKNVCADASNNTSSVHTECSICPNHLNVRPSLSLCLSVSLSLCYYWRC
jgi:hypothetical protein